MRGREGDESASGRGASMELCWKVWKSDERLASREESGENGKGRERERSLEDEN